MKIALVEPYVTDESLKSYAAKPEPSHLVGMYNLLEKEGIEVTLIDAFNRKFPPSVLAKHIADEAFTHVGLSSYDYEPCVQYLQQTLSHLEPAIITIIGGLGATYSTDRLAREVTPTWLVVGDGENALLALVRGEFDSDHTAVHQVNGMSTKVIRVVPMPMDDVPFERPYSLSSYGREASPRIQKGCMGNCVFCLGLYQKQFRYLSRARAEELFRYLIMEKHAEVISPCGPDFTAIPRKANDVLRALFAVPFQIRAFRPGVRLDTLYLAMKREPTLWQELGRRSEVNFESSIESFDFMRLQRLGKNVKLRFMAQIPDLIGEMLKICCCTIILGRIALDPTITLEEFIVDSEAYKSLLERFPDHVTVGGRLMNEFVPLWGTPSMVNGETNNVWAKRVPVDRRVGILKEQLLNHPQFQLWCQLAEQVSDFRERNEIFAEILWVATERARAVATVG